MRSLLAVSLMLVCFADKSYATFSDFMNNLPSEIANAFSTAWTSIADAIKKPVRIKRLGHGGNTPSEAATARDGNRVTIPVFPTPKFKSIDDWRSMQKAYYAKKKIDNGATKILSSAE